MRQFLAQFRPVIGPYAAAAIEGRIFRAADQFVEGYAGGSWASTQAAPGVWQVVVPTNAKTVRIVSPMNGADETLDAKSAGLALSILVVSWTWELLNDRLSEAQYRYFESLKDKLMTAISDPAKKYNASAIYSIID